MRCGLKRADRGERLARRWRPSRPRSPGSAGPSRGRRRCSARRRRRARGAARRHQLHSRGACGSSIAGQRSITTRNPAARARAAAAWSITPSCSQTPCACAAIASSTCAPDAAVAEDVDHVDPLGGRREPCVAALAEQLVARRVRVDGDDAEAGALQERATRCESRPGSGEQPTTAHVRVVAAAPPRHPSAQELAAQRGAVAVDGAVDDALRVARDRRCPTTRRTALRRRRARRLRRAPAPPRRAAGSGWGSPHKATCVRSGTTWMMSPVSSAPSACARCRTVPPGKWPPHGSASGRARARGLASNARRRDRAA